MDGKIEELVNEKDEEMGEQMAWKTEEQVETGEDNGDDEEVEDGKAEGNWSSCRWIKWWFEDRENVHRTDYEVYIVEKLINGLRHYTS